MKRLQDRVAVITGAASGIGRATAEQLAMRGCHLALVDLDEAGLEEAASALAAKGVRVSRHRADVAAAAEMEELPAQVLAEHGGVHLVVNNAGVSVLKDFRDHSLEDFTWLMGVNFWGVVHGCKFFLPHLLEQDEAHLVNISSMFGFAGVPGQSSYCASKFAVRGFTESLWAELEDTPVGVTSIHPGGIATNIARTVRVTREEDRAALQQNFDRYGHPPEDVARVILRCVERDELRGIVGREAFVAEWVKRLLPVRSHRWLFRRMRPTAQG